MDSLTFDGNFCDIAQCLEMRGGKNCPDGYCSQRRVWERLKQYEDAERDGRLVVLPCKVGSDVYRLTEKGAIYCYKIEEAKTYEEETVLEDCFTNEISLDDIGKTVFLTWDEAKAALAKRGSKNDVAD